MAVRSSSINFLSRGARSWREDTQPERKRQREREGLNARRRRTLADTRAISSSLLRMYVASMYTFFLARAIVRLTVTSYRLFAFLQAHARLVSNIVRRIFESRY